MKRIRSLPLWIVGVTAGAVSAQDAPAPPSREDLARAYVVFERALQSAQPDRPLLEELNRDFDRATLSFFTGQQVAAIQGIHGLIDRLGDSSPTAALALRVRPDAACAGDTVRAELRALYEVAALPPQLDLALDEGGATQTLRVGADVAARRAVVTAEVRLPESLEPGAYWMRARAPSGDVVAEARVFVLERPAQAWAESLRARLDAVRDPALREAVARARARVELLARPADPEDSARFLADLHALANALEQEVAFLETGWDPYLGRSGDLWTVLAGIPTRVFAPERAGSLDRTPLVVAFHGMGGDENMFQYGYGAGALRRLAEERGFVLVTPSAYPFARGVEAFDALLRAVQADYAIDPERIYVLGHSMGSRPAALLAADDPRIAAGCVFAGGVSGDAGADHPPFRIYAGALDPLSPPSRAERAVRRARDAGAPVELLRLEAYGHTLGVGARLPEAVDWLLTQRR